MSAPSPAALRVVRRIAVLWGLSLPAGAEQTAARLVDKETGLPELLEALEHTTEQIRLLGKVYQFTQGDEEVNAEIVATAERARARAEGL
jgi:hypothetical protein